jgi:flagellar biosynthesis protein FlhF
MGVSSLNADRVVQRLRADYGDAAPESLRSELALTRAALTNLWRSHKRNVSGFHVFVGPPGSGKSTVVAKWLTQAVLGDGESARVWRLDVPRANTAEALSLHCEALKVPMSRSWNPMLVWPEDHLFIDLPGLDTADRDGFSEVEGILSTIPAVTVSLVLNAAYDTSVLQAQVRAFSRLPVTDLVFTHLDEEPRWSKLWDFVLGTKYSLSFLSAGQNIPGQFLRASPEALFPEEMRAG